METIDSSIVDMLFADQQRAYILATRDLEIVQWYDPQQLLCLGAAMYTGKPLVCLLPQLLGYEPRIHAILDGSEPRFELSRISHITLDQLPVYLDLVVLPHRDVVGIITGIIVSIEDQTTHVCAEQAVLQQRNELRLQHEQLMRQNEQLHGTTMELERAVKVREELLATMSHELRTPLTSVLGMTEVLYRGICGPLNDEQMDAMRLISENGKHLMALINDILDFAKIDADRLAIEVNVVNIDDMCRSVMRMILPMARKKRLTATLHLDPQVVSLSADERRLKQVLVNLLSNAVKFTPEGGSIGLNVTPDVEHEQIDFTVWDTGIGISDADQRRLFQPFVQLDNGMALTRSGTGLGLALVRRLVTLHEGSIAVQSIPSKGSRFMVSLPWPAAMWPAALRSAQPVAAASVYDGAPDGLAADEQHEVVDLGIAEIADSRDCLDPLQQPTTILIADDDAGVRETLKKLLTKHSYRLAFAADGPTTLGQAARVLPDLILLDVMLPGMNGFEICRRIRNHPQMAEVPIVMITADGDRQTRLLGLRAGADDFITKPFDIGELEARINTITQLNRYRRLLQERAHSEAQLQRFNEELTRAYDATIEGWTHALDLRDHETEGHCRRVTDLTIKLARFMGYPEELLVHVRRGAILHDIGKIGVPDDILLKPGALTSEERQILEQHPVYAYQMLETIPYLRPALDIPYYHHERWDGTGYPRGLRGENIPLIARIFAVVDVYDALRNDRPYRSGWSEDKVRAYLIGNSGTHFDPDIVHAFISLLDTR